MTQKVAKLEIADAWLGTSSTVDRRVSRELERAILTIGRDSTFRRQYLRKRWQGNYSIGGTGSELNP